jgi:hypothetical protein
MDNKLSKTDDANHEIFESALHDLMAPGNLDEERIRQVIANYPTLVSQKTVQKFDDLSENASSVFDANFYHQMARLFYFLQTKGIEAGLKLFGHEARYMMKRDLRIMDERQKALKERFNRKPNSNWQALPTSIDGSEQLFPSLTSLIEYIQQEYPQRRHSALAMNYDSPRGAEKNIHADLPVYLYRGEAGVFPTTQSSLDRLFLDFMMPVESLEAILLTTNRIFGSFITKWQLPNMLAEGYLQHYGLPTHDIDVTSSLAVAAAFASDLAIGEIGAFCVMETRRIADYMAVIDLGGHPWADRPHRQHAYALTDPEGIYRDLKNPQAVGELGLKWFWFRFRPDDAEKYLLDPLLLDAYSDRAAGVISILMNKYRKIDDYAARWIANRVPVAPFVLKYHSIDVQGSKVNVSWVPAEVVDQPLPDEKVIRNGNYEYWSNKFAEPKRKDVPPDLLTPIEDLLPHMQSGSILQMLSPEAIESVVAPYLLGHRGQESKDSG